MIKVGENILEGTWEEIVSEGEQLAGKRVRLIVLPERNDAEVQPPPYPGGSLAEAMKGLIGVIHSGRKGLPPLSEDETSFGEYLEQKRREGRL
jgi:hypothetical protein